MTVDPLVRNQLSVTITEPTPLIDRDGPVRRRTAFGEQALKADIRSSRLEGPLLTRSRRFFAAAAAVRDLG